ncbi:MAG: SurA N-terminal domain-containing protein [Candidatus Omnitrophota bacterium]|nr:MAG: SurA N-terminal domain-containing protein [Candidatus Omnitrophota bacterium]
MLNKIRTRHSKKILWVLSVIIIISFTLWGGASFIQRKGAGTLGKIKGKEITASDLNYYYKMAQVYFLLFSPDKERKITHREITSQAWQYLLLLSKVKEDKIIADDQEVVEAIKAMFSTQEEGFNNELYNRFLRYRLRIEPRIFEEYIRNFIQIDKLFEKYAKVEITDEEVKNKYIKDTLKAKIDYISIPYEKFYKKIVVEQQEIEKFYDDNSDIFKEEEKVKIKYVTINKDNEVFDKVDEILTQVENINQLKEKVSLEVKETGFLGINDPIEGLGWNPQLNKEALSLKKGKLSSPFNIGAAVVIFEKVDERQAFLPPWEEIKEKITEKVKEEKAKAKAEKLCKELLEKIKNKKISNLKKLARKSRLEFKQTDFFKYYDYIEGMGMDENASKIIFSLEKDQIYSEPILLLKGAYIIKLVEKSAFDEEDFLKNKQQHYDFLFRQRSFMERIVFLSDLEKEYQLQIYTP